MDLGVLRAKSFPSKVNKTNSQHIELLLVFLLIGLAPFCLPMDDCDGKHLCFKYPLSASSVSHRLPTIFKIKVLRYINIIKVLKSVGSASRTPRMSDKIGCWGFGLVWFGVVGFPVQT